MNRFRTYFKKNNTLISDNRTNNSMNPVTEISYGTIDKQVSRFVFEPNLDVIQQRIDNGSLNPNNIVKHVLHMTNTISYAPKYRGRKSYSDDIYRTSSFDLELFNINEDWDEGSGYDFIYQPTVGDVEQASNWFERRTNVPWSYDGAYSGTTGTTGTSEIFATQRFEKGNEDIEIDITDYINGRLSGTTDSYGLGLKFTDDLEDSEELMRNAVAFHAKNTNTYYEPYIETIYDDNIKDDRNFFYKDKDNELYLYVNVGGSKQDIDVNGVTIYDFEGSVFDVISADSIINVSRGIYKITLNVSSDNYPDAVNFRDVWTVTINGRQHTYENKFYLIKNDLFYNFDMSNEIDIDNYHFYFWGIHDNETIVAGDVRNVRITVKEFYPNQNNFIPLDLEYRIFTTVGSDYELDVIPFTSVNRTLKGYSFNIDTSWLIPQDYYLQIRLKNGNYYENKERISFTIVSNEIKV